MSEDAPHRTDPRPGERLPLAEPVQKARAALAQAIAFLKEFQQDTHYPVVTRAEAEKVVEAIRDVDELASRLDPPFIDEGS